MLCTCRSALTLLCLNYIDEPWCQLPPCWGRPATDLAFFEIFSVGFSLKMWGKHGKTWQNQQHLGRAGGYLISQLRYLAMKGPGQVLTEDSEERAIAAHRGFPGFPPKGELFAVPRALIRAQGSRIRIHYEAFPNISQEYSKSHQHNSSKDGT